MGTTTAEKKACKDATTKVTTNATDIAAQVTRLSANKTWYTKNKDKYTTHNLTVAVADSNDAVTKTTAAHKAKACTPATDEKTKEEKATCAGYEKTIKDEGDLAATAKKLAGNATTALGLAANQNAWHKSALAHATTEAEAKKIQTADLSHLNPPVKPKLR